MHPNPSKFLTVLFSFIPGAGHMYFGLMKRGISFMAAFFASVAATVFTENYLSALTFVFVFAIPLAWFVSFFDFWRFPRMTAEERLELKDEFLMLDQLKIPKGPLLRKARIIAGIVLILGGASQLYSQFVNGFIVDFLHSDRMRNFMYMLPRLGSAVLVIVVGLLLIFWKGRQLKKEAKEATYDEE